MSKVRTDLQKYLESGKHLPKKMRDFHDQKDLFKSIHHLYQDDPHTTIPHSTIPHWTIGHQYVIDWFLWFMASRGYTLQKNKKTGVKFKKWPTYREILREERLKDEQ